MPPVCGREFSMPHTPPCIIVADDESLILDLVAELLDDEGSEVHVYRTAVAAALAIATHLPDVVIVDLQMEKFDSGLQLVQMMRLKVSTASIPVILMSANEVFLRASRAQLGARGCAVLEKPFGIDTLLECVREALRSRT
jgi:CheY-like chemotaxis protein